MNDCSFEKGWCGWHNYEDELEVERKRWVVYNCSSKMYREFIGLEKDQTYEGGTGE